MKPASSSSAFLSSVRENICVHEQEDAEEHNFSQVVEQRTFHYVENCSD